MTDNFRERAHDARLPSKYHKAMETLPVMRPVNVIQATFMANASI